MDIKKSESPAGLSKWIVHYANDATVRKANCSEYIATVTLPRRQGEAELLCLVITSICDEIIGLGIEFGSAESRSEVTGLVQIYANSLPYISSIGALVQFHALFPLVKLEFAEQVGQQASRIDKEA